MVRLCSLQVISCAKIYGIITVVIGSYSLVRCTDGLIGDAAAPGQQRFGMIGVLILAALLTPYLYGAIGLVISPISALLYNWASIVWHQDGAGNGARCSGRSATASSCHSVCPVVTPRWPAARVLES